MTNEEIEFKTKTIYEKLKPIQLKPKSVERDCPFDENIKCDTEYGQFEFLRQLAIACNTTGWCKCNKDLCPRYLAAQQKQR